MKIRTTIAALSFLAAATVFGQQHPNLVKGFNTNGVYQFNGLDTVNAFNGNLNVRIPLGQPYSVSPGLSYQFALVWNNNQWLSRQEGSIYENCCTLAYPSHRSNAGFGWTMSLGRLYPASQMEGTGDWTFESADGADHQFFDELHPENDGLLGSPTPPNDPISYTRDGSYIRMQFNVATNQRIVELPDGTVYTFAAPPYNEGPWRLEKISDGYSANYVNIAYDDTALIWTVSDSRGRQHKIYFQDVPGYDDGGRQLVDRLELATFGGTTAHYDLTYLEDQSTARPFWHDPEHHDTTVPRRANLWFLESVRGGTSLTTPNTDDTTYSFAYDLGASMGFHPGQVYQMNLPTGGTIVWDLLQYPLPVQGELYLFQESFGVSARKAYARGVVPGASAPLSTVGYSATTRCDPVTSYTPCIARDSITTIRNYDGAYDPYNLSSPAPISRSEHYFSVSTFDYGIWSAGEYGQPFTHMASSGGAWLSEKQYAGTSASPLKSSYVRYDCDKSPDGRCIGTANRRVDLSRVVHDADLQYWMRTLYTDFDGYGHYRNALTNSSFPNTPERTTVVNYNAGRGTYPSYPNSSVMIPANEPWRTGLASYTKTQGSGKVFTSEMVFDTKGFLTRKRLIQNTELGATGTKDVIAVFAPDTRGRVASEEYYGGDSGAVGTQALSAATLGNRIYRVDHTETAPDSSGNWSEQSKFYGANDSLRDVTIDRNTGQVSVSRDAAGVATVYVFDFMGRMTREKPTGRAWATAEYVTTGNSEIKLKQFPNGQESGTPLTSSRYEIDGLGRVTRELTTMPGGTESDRNTFYDGLGRRTWVSELGAPAAGTTFTYDAQSRPLTATSADGSITKFSYVGDRTKTRTSYLATPLSAAKAVSTVEEYDGYGRLIAVTEPSGATTAAQPNGTNVRTEYTYDPADHLVAVKMNALGSPVQHRFFDYDGRGFLRWESQSESGMTSYTYDARGNALSKTQGAANTQFDLKFFYDSSGRPMRVDARNPWYPEYPAEPEFRVMKVFAYGDTNGTVAPVDLRKGKLTTASRYNYISPYFDWVKPMTYKISDNYEYRDPAGRRTSRDTTIFDGEWFAKSVSVSTSYNDLDLPVAVAYPMCDGCGYPPQAVDRSGETRTYDQGQLKSVSGFIGSITYWPNGMRKLLPHANGVDDKQEVGAMARPTQIAFGQYDRCVKPKFVLQPGSDTVAPDAEVTLHVSVTGTAPILYEWWDNFGNRIPPIPIDETSITVTPATTTEYHVYATNECGQTVSQAAKVTVTGCALPATGVIAAVTQPDRSWILTPDPTARAQRTYQWKRLSDNAPLGTAETQAVGTLSQTTSFSLTITDECGSATSNVTIVVPLSMSTTGLSATANGTYTEVNLTWPAVTSATSYAVERRSGGGWEVIGSPTGTSFADSQVIGAKTYAYRVKAAGTGGSSNYSNVDVATTMAFPPPIAGQAITATTSDQMLTAVNKIREAAGWAAVTWLTILSPSDPVVAVSNRITARQLLACRARMNEALQAIGASAVSYADPDAMQSGIKALHIQEVLEAVQ